MSTGAICYEFHLRNSRDVTYVRTAVMDGTDLGVGWLPCDLESLLCSPEQRSRYDFGRRKRHSSIDKIELFGWPFDYLAYIGT